ncbi:MAG: sigma-70 family RNA polymerase sigma factor [Oscillospiraceae bacterium]|nr:sigma-70 family RNA polymerase sigma factor [Oscillospiraceae bacterium]
MTHYVSHSDDTLVELSLLGDQSAFEELVGRHERSVLGTALKITENQYSAQDASQDAFVSAWINLDRLKERSKFGSWVCSIAKNKARTLVIHYRNAIPDISLDLLTYVSDEENSELMEMLTQDDSAAELHEAVDALSERIREAIKLHYFEGLSVAEIAMHLSLPAGTVKWRLSQGRKQLRKEYGLMETKYDDTERVLARVMRQVEQLKLWRLKDDKTGFEEEYRRVLQAVEDLQESKEKQYALADTLMAGYWWLPGEQNDTVLARMKEAALQGHNEEVMQCVVANEHDKYSGAKRIEFIKETQIPWLEEKGFPKSLAYVYFWLGVSYIDENNYDECIQAFEKVIELLEPEDVYYANALAALDNEKTRKRLGTPEEKFFYSATGEVYKYIDGKLYFWTQPGYTRGWLHFSNNALFWNASRPGNLIYDPDMKVGDVATANNGNKLTYREKGITIDTPAGIFEDCSVFVFEGNSHGLTYCETAFCPNVGIVQQKVIWGNTNTWKLENYTVQGGTGLLPFASGNKWCYTTDGPEGILYDIENIFEITAVTEDSATVKANCFCHLKAYDENSWLGKIQQARHEYAVKLNNEHYKLSDVSQPLARAAQLVQTKREKVHTAIATNVMERIFATAPDWNPNYTEKGFWNFFERINLTVTDGRPVIEREHDYSFEWKDRVRGNEGSKVLYSFLYDILCDAAGCVWDDAWVPGYHLEKGFDGWREKEHLVFDVLEDESVTTIAGEFKNCRHITFTLTGKGGGNGYRGGTMDYWFAPGVGIVKFSRPYGKEKELDCIWTLTEYKGTGEGYFPIDDGLFRRYEPTQLGDGWHASVEYTFDVDETGTVLFRNALGTQDRTNYEAAQAAQENKK